MRLFTRRAPPPMGEGYEYCRSKDGLILARPFPARELAYRKENDPKRDATWGQLTTAAQIGALRNYLELAQRVGAPHSDGLLLGSLLLLVEPMMLDAQPSDRLDDPEKLRLGQRIANGIAKVWCNRVSQRQEERYWEAAGRVPPQRAAWSSDRGFAFMRVAGMVPFLLREAGSEADVAACCDIGQLNARLGAAVLANAIHTRRVYIVPSTAFELLSQLVTRTDLEHPHRPRFLATCSAVFLRDDAGYLVPLAIGIDGRSVFPDQGNMWRRAKLHFQVAESLYHTFVAHLPQTHFLLEPVIIATHREFGMARPNHPVFRLLEPHTAGTIAVNYVTEQTAFAEDTPFAEFIACTHASTMKMAAAAFDERAKAFTTHFDTGLPSDTTLVHPFRDDYTDLRECLRVWVAAFIRLHYVDDNAVANDAALMRWSTELRCYVPGFPEVDTIECLVHALRTIVELASLQHAAIHFPQTDIGRFSVVAPYFASDLPPTSDPSLEARLDPLASLPDIHAAAWQSFVLGQAEVRWRTLDALQIRSTSAAERDAATRLHQDLDRIDRKIQDRNAALVRDGLWSYEYLRPRNVPCSVNT